MDYKNVLFIVAAIAIAIAAYVLVENKSYEVKEANQELLDTAEVNVQAGEEKMMKDDEGVMEKDEEVATGTEDVDDELIASEAPEPAEVEETEADDLSATDETPVE